MQIYRVIFMVTLILMIPLVAFGNEALSLSNSMDIENKVENLESQMNRKLLYPSPELNSKYFGVSIGAIPFSNNIKEESMIGNGSGLALDFGYAYKDKWAFNGGVGFLGAKDNGEKFSKMVCPQYTGPFCDNPKEKDSSLNIYSISAETGLQHRMSLTKVHPKMFFLVGGYIGYRGLLVSREITNCSDCGGDSYYYNGMYIASMIAFGANYTKHRDIYMYCRYENYVSGDSMEPALWIGLARSIHY